MDRKLQTGNCNPATLKKDRTVICDNDRHILNAFAILNLERYFFKVVCKVKDGKMKLNQETLPTVE